MPHIPIEQNSRSPLAFFMASDVSALGFDVVRALNVAVLGFNVVRAALGFNVVRVRAALGLSALVSFIDRLERKDEMDAYLLYIKLKL